MKPRFQVAKAGVANANTHQSQTGNSEWVKQDDLMRARALCNSAIQKSYLSGARFGNFQNKQEICFDLFYMKDPDFYKLETHFFFFKLSKYHMAKQETPATEQNSGSGSLVTSNVKDV